MTLSTLTITVIDDDAQVRRAFGRIFRAFGYTTNEFASAEDFLASEPEGTGCLLLDIDLTGMSGIDLYRKILQRQGPVPPVVFVTGKPSAALESAARMLGAVDFLVKPVDAQNLVHAVQRAEGGKPCAG
jgi:FixJ family two-component response regulator